MVVYLDALYECTGAVYPERPLNRVCVSIGNVFVPARWNHAANMVGSASAQNKECYNSGRRNIEIRVE